MIMITSPKVVNATPPVVTKGIDDTSWFSMPRTSTVLSGCLAMTLKPLPAAPQLAHMFTKEHTEK